jgi:hypothetical protein
LHTQLNRKTKQKQNNRRQTTRAGKDSGGGGQNRKEAIKVEENDCEQSSGGPARAQLGYTVQPQPSVENVHNVLEHITQQQ